MTFIKEKISEFDKQVLNSFELRNPITKEELQSRRWTTDRERNTFLATHGK